MYRGRQQNQTGVSKGKQDMSGWIITFPTTAISGECWGTKKSISLANLSYFFVCVFN